MMSYGCCGQRSIRILQVLLEVVLFIFFFFGVVGIIRS